MATVIRVFFIMQEKPLRKDSLLFYLILFLNKIVISLEFNYWVPNTILPKFMLQGTLLEECNNCSATPIDTIPAQKKALFSYYTPIVSTYTRFEINLHFAATYITHE
ncbi:hypothetical protein QL285_086682 [Trifolium repens]|nr:hypothetical protein QL285_086682 [Trifolium repens]